MAEKKKVSQRRHEAVKFATCIYQGMQCCGFISKIMVLHLKTKVYMKTLAVFTH